MASNAPWWTKIGAKLVLSRLPVPYGVWSRLGIFRHGDMADPTRAINAFRAHFDRASQVRALPSEFTMLELGPGDSILSAAAARACGAQTSWLVDNGDFAQRDPALFYALDEALPGAGLRQLDLPAEADFDTLLAHVGARYLTDGNRSLSQIPSASVDLIWSSVVLEHVLRDEFADMARELARILKPQGVMSHAVDLRDHLGGSLNNLRFAHELWESPGWRRAGFYTNRMSQAEIIAAFKQAGFQVVGVTDDLWPTPPLDRAKMHPMFRGRTDEELRVAGFDITLVLI